MDTTFKDIAPLSCSMSHPASPTRTSGSGTHLVRVCESIPIVLVGNKVDVKERKVKVKQINFPRKHAIQYYDISAKSNYQFEKPFIWLLKKLTGDVDLALVEAPALQAQEFVIDPKQIQEMEEDLQKAENAVIDDNDEDI